MYYIHDSTHLDAHAWRAKEESSSSIYQTKMDTLLVLKSYIVNMTKDKMETSNNSSYDNIASMAANDLSINSKLQKDNNVRLKLQRTIVPLKEYVSELWTGERKMEKVFSVKTDCHLPTDINTYLSIMTPSSHNIISNLSQFYRNKLTEIFLIL